MTLDSAIPAPPSSPELLREEVRSWVSENWDPDLSLFEWRERLLDARWAMPAWPERWHGRGWPEWTEPIVASELVSAGAVGVPLGAGTGLAGPTILEHGSDALRERFLRPLLTGEERWCQLFSEPSAGSDLAGVSTTARLEGDEWVINGQKVWTTSAHHADYGILVARTDLDVPKHQGLTFFVIPMHQPGVEVRPIRQMNDYSSFNEVFLTDARLPKDYVVGEIGDGWKVALTTLAFERRASTVKRPVHSDSGGRALAEAKAEADAHFKTYSWYPQRAGRVDLALERALSTGKIDDPTIRQELIKLLTLERAASWTASRARAAAALGRAPGPEGSLAKLAHSEISRQANRVHTLLAGARGMLNDEPGTDDGVTAEIILSTPAQSIAGGTDEIQKNIIGEKVLGLPRERNDFKSKAFRDIPRNA